MLEKYFFLLFVWNPYLKTSLFFFKLQLGKLEKSEKNYTILSVVGRNFHWMVSSKGIFVYWVAK